MIKQSSLYLFFLAAVPAACDSASVVPTQDSGITAIQDVQGTGGSSPLVGNKIEVSGIVTGDFQSGDTDSQNDLRGFFVQQKVATADGNASIGLFIYDGTVPETDVNPGDLVLVEGEVVEYFGETQIKATSVKVTGSGTLEAIAIDFPADVIDNSEGKEIADLERFEGMFVRLPQSMTVASLFGLERYGDVQLVAGARRFAFTNYSSPDVAGYSRHRTEFAAHTILLDDGLSVRNAVPIRYLYPDPVAMPGYSIRVGDTVSGLTGNIRFSRGSGGTGEEAFRLVPSGNPEFVNSNPRNPMPPTVGGNLKIASLNLQNFFTTIDNGQHSCGPQRDDNCRGANNVAEFDRQRGRILTTLTILDADIFALVELENNDSESIRSLVNGLNDLGAGSNWSFIDTGTIGSDAIKVGIIYDNARIAPIGDFAILDNSVDSRFLDSRNRPVLLQSFRQILTDSAVSIAVAHLKSKNSSCVSDGDPKLGDGQSNCNETRTSAVMALTDWLATDPTASGDPDFLVLGDLNAYLEEGPLIAFKNAGFVNLLAKDHGSEAYTYQYRGRSGAVDHALASPSLFPQVEGAREWHINADEPPVLDYNLESARNATLFDRASPFRVSDHDPLVIGLDLEAEQL